MEKIDLLPDQRSATKTKRFDKRQCFSAEKLFSFFFFFFTSLPYSAHVNVAVFGIGLNKSKRVQTLKFQLNNNYSN